MNKSTIISWLTGILTLSLAVFAFILSFNALTDLALKHGVSVPPLFPFVVEFAVIVFSLNALYRSLHNEPAKWQWSLIIGSSLLAGTFNVIHANDDYVSKAMAAMPSLFLLLSFESFVSLLKYNVKRSQQITTLSAWDNALAIAQKGFNDLRDQTNKALEERDNTINNLTKALEIANNPVAYRRQMVYEARQGEQPIPFKVLAEEWNVSEQTIKNDIAHYQNGR